MISVVESSKKRARKTQHQGFFSAIKHDGGGIIVLYIIQSNIFPATLYSCTYFFIKLHTENSTCCNYASGMLTKGSHLYNHLQ